MLCRAKFQAGKKHLKAILLIMGGKVNPKYAAIYWEYAPRQLSVITRFTRISPLVRMHPVTDAI